MTNNDNLRKAKGKMTITFPKLFTCKDYHEIPEVTRFLNKLQEKGAQEIRSEEVGFINGAGKHIGLLYTGRCPSRKAIKKIAKTDIINGTMTDFICEEDIVWDWE